MRSLFQWINQRREAQLFDISSEKWEAVGPTDTNIDWSTWLQEEAPSLPAQKRARLQGMARESLRSVEARLEGSTPRAAVMPVSAHKQAPAESPGAGPRARIHTPPPSDGKWVEVLKSYGEHLTEEELLIIRRQLTAR